MSNTESDILHGLRPRFHESAIVESSARRKERIGEGRPGNAAEKLGALIGRMDTMLDDERYEARLKAHLTDRLVIRQNDIPESYWQQQVQLARNDGHFLQLDWEEKFEIAEAVREQQIMSLETWYDHLDADDDNYPTWFKLYAFEGMTHLGTFDTEKGYFNRRSRSTVTPFAPLNKEALRRTYDAACTADYKDVDFNKLYSQFLFEVTAHIATPESPGEIEGEWREYTAEDIKALTEAAQGTPWCIKHEKHARNYLDSPDNRFILFHLKSSEAGTICSTAAASIRLQNGNVVEVSGLAAGSEQVVEDSLVPIVSEKVSSLPGGDYYLQAFQDRQRLIEMDKKFAHDEPFTLSELHFLYETDRPIYYLKTPVSHDPRVKQFKTDRAQHYHQFTEAYGTANASVLMEPPSKVMNRLGELKEKGADSELILRRFAADDIIRNYNAFEIAGIEVDLENLVDKISSRLMLYSLHTFIDRDIEIDVKSLMRCDDIGPMDLAHEAADLLAAGADVEELYDLIRHNSQAVARCIDTLVRAGLKIDIEAFVSTLEPTIIVLSSSQLQGAGAKIDIREVARRLRPYLILEYMSYLQDAGMEYEEIQELMKQAGVKI